MTTPSSLSPDVRAAVDALNTLSGRANCATRDIADADRVRAEHECVRAALIAQAEQIAELSGPFKIGVVANSEFGRAMAKLTARAESAERERDAWKRAASQLPRNLVVRVPSSGYMDQGTPRYRDMPACDWVVWRAAKLLSAKEPKSDLG